MVRALWLLAVASAVTLAALWIAGQEGEITVAIPGQEFRVSLAAGLFLLILFIAACIFAYRFLSFLGVLPQQLSRWNDARRRRNGYLALTRGLVATAAGDNDEARSNTKKALALMGEPPLALLLAAQSAQLEGNDKDAERYFTAMLQSPEMEFLGLRGLYMAAQRKGDPERALELAARAFALRPKAPWVVNALFDLQIQRQDWPQAALTLEQAGRTKNLDPNILRRRRAVLLAAQAMQAEEAGDGAKALGFAKDALAIAPGLTAAALIAAKRMALGGRLWRASAVLEQAWAKEPHPDIARAYAALKADEAPRSRGWRLSGLTAQAPDHPESRILSASIALGAGDAQSAREALRPLTANLAPARVCALMAEIERMAGDEAQARTWLQRSLTAPHDALWGCQACARQFQSWNATCPNCHAFDALTWQAGVAAKIAKDTAEQAHDHLTSDFSTVLYREAVKPDPTARPVGPRPMPASPEPASAVPATLGVPGTMARPGETEIFRPQHAPDDPGPDTKDWDEGDADQGRQKGAVW